MPGSQSRGIARPNRRLAAVPKRVAHLRDRVSGPDLTGRWAATSELPVRAVRPLIPHIGRAHIGSAMAGVMPPGVAMGSATAAKVMTPALIMAAAMEAGAPLPGGIIEDAHPIDVVDGDAIIGATMVVPYRARRSEGPNRNAWGSVRASGTRAASRTARPAGEVPSTASHASFGLFPCRITPRLPVFWCSF